MIYQANSAVALFALRYIGIKLYYSNFVYSTNPFVMRGGNFNNGSNAGLFYFNNNTGGTNANNGFRPVLSATLRYTKDFLESYPR